MEPDITTECLLKMPLGSPNQQTSLAHSWLTTHTVRVVLVVFVAVTPPPFSLFRFHFSSCLIFLLPSSVGPTMDLSAFKDGLEVIVPHPLVIRVPITGYPTPVAKWTFGEKELTTADERVSLTTKSTFTELIVTPSVRPDKGTYTLQLENDTTSVSGEIDVNVIGTCEFFLEYGWILTVQFIKMMLFVP